MAMATEAVIQKLLREGEILKAEQLLSCLPQANAGMVILYACIKIFRAEVQNDVSHTIFDYSLEIDELAGHFIKLKLLIRRLEFDLPNQYQEELFWYCKEKEVSEYLILSILLTNIFKREKVCRQLIDLFGKAEGMDSHKVQCFQQALCYLEDIQNG